MAERNNNIETNEPKTRKASTVFKQGDWLQSDGAGAFEPLNPTEAVVALCMENVDSTHPKFASEGLIMTDLVAYDNDRFLMEVGTGTATANMEGLSYDVAAADSSKLDVSAAGTQFRIVRFITSTLVEVSVNTTV